MFEPRPEISTATLLRSAMMGGGPVFAGAPSAVRAADGAAGLARLDAADTVRGFACRTELFDHLRGIGVADDGNHADAAVEGPRQLRRFDRAAGLEESEQRRKRPIVSIYDSVAALRQNPRNILEKTATRDMR